MPRSVTSRAVRSYRTLSALLIVVRRIRAASRLFGTIFKLKFENHDPIQDERTMRSFLSVALSVGLRRPGVTRHRLSMKSGLSSSRSLGVVRQPSDPLIRA